MSAGEPSKNEKSPNFTFFFLLTSLKKEKEEERKKTSSFCEELCTRLFPEVPMNGRPWFVILGNTALCWMSGAFFWLSKPTMCRHGLSTVALDI